MLGDVRAQKYSKTGAPTRSILEKFAFDTTLKTMSRNVHILWAIWLCQVKLKKNGL